MRSGNTLYSPPCKRSTPSTIRVSVPIPEIFAPIAFKKFAKSHTSGSRAAFLMMDVPSASTVAIKIFSVPVTVTKSVTISAPFKRPVAVASM